jgi:hypothetical protein
VQPNNINMAEPINLDELLTKSEPVIEDTTDTTEPTDTEPTDQADNAAEGEGVDDVVEDNNPQNDEVITDENAGTEEADEEVYIKTDGSSDEAAEPVAEDTPEEVKTEPTEYKFKDDFIKKAVDYYETYGTLQPFLEATQIDYDTVDDSQLLKMKFDKENSDLPAKTRERLFQKELEKYNLDSYEDDDIELGQALLKRDANKLRLSLKEEQTQFLQSIQPAAQEQQSEAQQEQLRAQQEQHRQLAKSGVEGALKNNYIKVGANGEGINFQVADTNRVVDFALDSTQFLSTFAKQDGSVDWEKWVKVVAFTENPDLFVGELIKHGKSLGRKAMEAELKNFKPDTKSKVVVQGDEGSDSPYDDTLGFLKGMKVTRK